MLQNQNPKPETGADEIRVAQVEQEVNALGVNAKDLEQIVSELQAKVGPVMRSLPPDGKPESVPTPVLVPLAGRLSEICAMVRGSVNRLREIRAAIEL